jgi:nitrogen fixation protein NifX
MNAAGLSRATALRIGLAARALPDTPPARLMDVLVAVLGLPLTDDKLERLTVRTLKNALDGALAETEAGYLKQAVRFLKGELTVDLDEIPPAPQPYRDGDLPGSIRVAFASNRGEWLDGHFGSCARFLIYQVAANESRLIDVREVQEPDAPSKDDRQAYRVGLIRDCHLLYVVSIGGPPAARVVNAGIHPLKHLQETAIAELLPSLQRTLAGHPPPWLAKRIGADTMRPLVETDV